VTDELLESTDVVELVRDDEDDDDVVSCRGTRAAKAEGAIKASKSRLKCMAY
jgi:hypothetical protein